MEKKITILNRNYKKLSAIFHTPKNTTDKVVIMIHSFKGDKDYQPIMRDGARKLCVQGYAVIRFDCYGSGESEGSFEQATVSSEVRDLKDVITFVKDKGYEQIALIGLSLGATVAILGYDKTIKSLILWSPPFTHKRLYENYKEEIKKKGFVSRKRILTGEKVKVGKAMWEEFGTINLKNKIKIIKCPILVVFGAKDHIIGLNIIKKYFEMFSCIKEIESIKGGDHDFLIPEAKEKAITKTIKWVNKYL